MKVRLSKEFMTRLVGLKKSGRKKQYEQTTMILTELQMDSEISKEFRPDARIPNCRKFELPDFHRVVFQKIENCDEILALFVGSHAEADKFLDNHRGWIFNPGTSGLLRLNIASYENELTNIVPSLEIQVDKQPAVEILKIPIFEELGPELLKKAGVPEEKIEQAMNLLDPDSIEVMEFMESLESTVSDKLLAYLCCSANDKEEIIELLKGNRILVNQIDENISKALPENPEQFIELNDLSEEQRAFESMPLEDWMLFLHPKQNEFVLREFNGPARLRGVSGSGKTVVAIHRARNAARKILNSASRKNVLFLTYNRSLAELVEKLISQLCSMAEAKRIKVCTIDKWCRDYLSFRGLRISVWDNQLKEELWHKSVIECKDDLKEAKLLSISNIDKNSFKFDKDIQFLEEEVDFLMGKFQHRDIEDYLDCDRTGRVKRLTKDQRQGVLDLYEKYLAYLLDNKQYIPKELNRTALTYLLRPNEFSECEYSDVIVDEVQDLSEIELLIIKRLSFLCGSGLLLVGDGAQKIYTRGYAMKNLGIDVVGRSFVLKRNYRNTREIMHAASLLRKGQNVGKYDEDPEIAQTDAIYSQFSGEKPLVIISKNPQHEWELVAKEIRYLIKQMKLLPYEICCLARVDWERQGLLRALNSAKIKAAEYKAEGIGALDAVKITTLHNSKGHEFKAIFILGFFEGAIPLQIAIDEPEELEREAAILYVAMTRAKQLLYMLYPKVDSNNKELHPSRFLNDFKDAIEIIDES